MAYDHDNRLDNLTAGQFRMWRDCHQQMIPIGESTTRPLTPEIVKCKIEVYGAVKHGFMGPPIVDFLNTDVATRRFDKYHLAIWRSYSAENQDDSNLPFNNPTIDYNADLGLKAIWAYVNASFVTSDDIETFQGSFAGMVLFRWTEGLNWVSDILHFSHYELNELYGDFFLVVNPTISQLAKGPKFDTETELQSGTLPIDIVLVRATIKNGNSEMRLLRQNEDYEVEIGTFELALKGGE